MLENSRKEGEDSRVLGFFFLAEPSNRLMKSAVGFCAATLGSLYQSVVAWARSLTIYVNPLHNEDANFSLVRQVTFKKRQNCLA